MHQDTLNSTSLPLTCLFFYLTWVSSLPPGSSPNCLNFIGSKCKQQVRATWKQQLIWFSIIESLNNHSILANLVSQYVEVSTALPDSHGLHSIEAPWDLIAEIASSPSSCWTKAFHISAVPLSCVNNNECVWMVMCYACPQPTAPMWDVPMLHPRERTGREVCLLYLYLVCFFGSAGSHAKIQLVMARYTQTIAIMKNIER